MGETTEIAWCHHTFNPWIGCEKVSQACKFCYASVDTFARASRARGLELWGHDAARHVTSDANWKLPARWDRAAMDAHERRRMFCASLADIFEKRPDLEAPRERLFDLVTGLEWLDVMFLSKRPENMVAMTRKRWGMSWPKHVWAGTTVEDRDSMDRIAHLQGVPAAIRFLSVEPLLESIDLTNHLEGISLVIVGGESGPKARPFDLAWAERLRDQCKDAGVPWFFKQAGSRPFHGEICVFGSFDQWVAKARDWTSGRGGWFVDARGRTLTVGSEFARARDEGTFPVHVLAPLKLRDRKGGDLSELPESVHVRQMPGEARQ